MQRKNASCCQWIEILPTIQAVIHMKQRAVPLETGDSNSTDETYNTSPSSASGMIKHLNPL